MDINLEDNTKEDRLYNLLTAVTFETNFFKRIQALEVIFGMLDDELGQAVDIDEFKEFLIGYTDDKEFMRKTRLVSAMEDNPETCLELYGFDYISSPDYQYDEDYMNKRRFIEKRINLFIGKLMHETLKQEDLLI